MSEILSYITELRAEVESLKKDMADVKTERASPKNY